MSAPQGLFYFTGIQSLLSGSFTLSHGVSPSTATLYIPPQTGALPNVAELKLTYGGVVLRFPDCKIFSCDFEEQSDGRKIWALTIQDTRWRWKFGRISGEYNLRRADGEPRPETIKKPQELAKLLFAAIGVTNYDVSRLPNNVFPERIWEYARADQELARLCEELGCRVVLSAGNKVTLWPDGVGSPLPLGNDVLDNSLAFQPMDRPDVLRFVGGRTLWNADLLMEAVGKDLDGSIKPLDKLSYKPEVGWEYYDIATGQQVKDLKARRLALDWVYKAYRIKTPFKLMGEEIKDLARILPITEKQVITAKVEGIDEALPALIYGQFCPGNNILSNNVPERITGDLQSNPKEQYHGTADIDTDLGIVRFADPLYKAEFDNASRGYLLKPAKLYLRTAISLRDEGTLAWRHYEQDLPIPGPKTGTKPLHVIHDDVALKHWTEFSERERVAKNNLEDSPGKPGTFPTPGVKRMAEYYLKAELARWQDKTPGTITYAGFKTIIPDGAIQQVSWIVSDSGEARTRASRNRDEAAIGLTYQERRYQEKVVAMLGANPAGEGRKVRR